MPDYSKAKLYAIRSHETEDVYIGSSCVRLSQRLHVHRGHYKAFKQGKRNYITSFEIIKHPDNYIELIRAVPCSSKEELHKLEGDEIRSTRCVNKFIPGRTKKQYYEDHKEKIDKYQKQYKEDNKEHVAKYQKNYYDENKEQQSQLAKEYYKKNKDIAKQRAKKNYHESKNIRECLCGISYNCGSKHRSNRHYASKIHKKYVFNFYTRLNQQLTE